MSEGIAIEASEVFDSLEDGQELYLHVQGNSMSPFLKDQRDTVILKKPSSVKVGDVVVFKYGTQYIMHRIISINGNQFTALGDNRNYSENNIPLQNIVAVVTGADRKGKRITEKSVVWNFYSKLFIKPAVRNAIRKIISRR